jgi:hypothetical protein
LLVLNTKLLHVPLHGSFDVVRVFSMTHHLGAQEDVVPPRRARCHNANHIFATSKLGLHPVHVYRAMVSGYLAFDGLLYEVN